MDYFLGYWRGNDKHSVSKWAGTIFSVIGEGTVLSKWAGAIIAVIGDGIIRTM